MFFSVSRSTKPMTFAQRLHTAGLGKIRAADQQSAAEELVELLEHFRGGLLQNRDTHRDFGLQLRLARRQHGARLFGRHVDEDERDRLRMFFLDELE